MIQRSGGRMYKVQVSRLRAQGFMFGVLGFTVAVLEPSTPKRAVLTTKQHHWRDIQSLEKMYGVRGLCVEAFKLP